MHLAASIHDQPVSLQVHKHISPMNLGTKYGIIFTDIPANKELPLYRYRSINISPNEIGCLIWNNTHGSYQQIKMFYTPDYATAE